MPRMGLIEAECDLIMVDTAHGIPGCAGRHHPHQEVSNYVHVAGGNIATAEGARALIDAARRCG